MTNITVNNRRCPVCGSHLELIRDKFKDHGKYWEVYRCPNDKSEIWVAPFAGLKLQ